MANISTDPQTQTDLRIKPGIQDHTINDPMIQDRARQPADFVNEELIDSIWQALDGRVSHELIKQSAYQVASRYGDAKVLTFITIFIRRQTLEMLKQ